MILLREVNKWYGEFHVLKAINLEVRKGQKVVVCGPSGSGKSTMIRCINRLEEHQRGQIVVDGIELTSDVKNVDAIRREVGMVFQHFNLFPHLIDPGEPHACADVGPRTSQEGGRGDGHALPDAGCGSPSRRRNIRASSPAASSSASPSPAPCA